MFLLVRHESQLANTQNILLTDWCLLLLLWWAVVAHNAAESKYCTDITACQMTMLNFYLLFMLMTIRLEISLLVVILWHTALKTFCFQLSSIFFSLFYCWWGELSSLTACIQYNKTLKLSIIRGKYIQAYLCGIQSKCLIRMICV